MHFDMFRLHKNPRSTHKLSYFSNSYSTTFRKLNRHRRNVLFYNDSLKFNKTLQVGLNRHISSYRIRTNVTAGKFGDNI